ncbi:MAG: amino acid permease [Candidatus Melainabacteria bacterium]|nr:amino acid permease [Candidatus Melainabacteria bacterium]
MGAPSVDKTEFQPVLGTYSATMLVAGGMIGSGIFIVSADIARQVQSATLLVLIWLLVGVLTVLGATAYGKLAGKLPKAGGQYVFLREAWGPFPAFLYGWALLWVIQTGILAAVAMAFAKFAGVIWPVFSAQPLLEIPLMGVGISAQQLLALAALWVLTLLNTTGIKNGALLQNVFTSIKVLVLLVVTEISLLCGPELHQQQWSTQLIDWQNIVPLLATASVGALFAADTWNYVTFIGGEVKDPHRTLPKALTWGTILVVSLYVLVNLAYLNLLPLEEIQHASEDRVATVAVEAVLGSVGAQLTAGLILVSTFGCLNGLMLTGARVFYAMARDGLLLPRFGWLHPKTKTPNTALWGQCAWASVLALSGSYSQLLDYIVFTALVFYIVTMLGLMRLGKRDPVGYRMQTVVDWLIPSVYVLGISVIGFFLLVGEDKWQTSVTGLLLTATGWPVYVWIQRRQQSRSAA